MLAPHGNAAIVDGRYRLFWEMYALIAVRRNMSTPGERRLVQNQEHVRSVE